MRKLVAALACRMAGSRLYGKPIQNLDISSQYTILDNILATLNHMPCISECILGIADGIENEAIEEYAKKKKLSFVRGDEVDVLSRLIKCGHTSNATDVFRITTECPFIYFESLEELWRRHVDMDNDLTAIDGLPEGVGYEFFKLSALEKSHKLGDERHRSELCSLYIRENIEQFKVEVTIPENRELLRYELRLTVDYPEDLVLCRKVFQNFKSEAPLIPLHKIIDYLDENPEVKNLVREYIEPDFLYATKEKIEDLCRER